MDNYPQIAGEGKRWPVLRLDDGGLEVHKLQVLLDDLGYYSGEEDMQYWNLRFHRRRDARGTHQVRSIQKFFTHRPVSTFDRVPFQLTGELFLYGTTLRRPRVCRTRG